MRTRFINSFAAPIKEALNKEGLKFSIKGRPKSIASIWNKMQKQKVSFEDIYDIFAIRIVLETNPEQEKSDAWRTYSVVTDFYPPNPDRLRDWISIPKANGYESLHTTVMSPTGKWVEVQIRSERMDEIAEKGYAAHWRYKGQQADSRLDQWIGQIREVIEGGEDSALEFVDELKLDLFNEEVYVFTPNGDLIVLAKGATALDFAFRVHSQVGQKCIGAKVNKKLVPIGHVLESGDQIEILTSRKQKPKEDWLNMVVTASARSKVRAALRANRKKLAAEGKDKLRKQFKKLGIDFIQANLDELANRVRLDSPSELFVRMADGRLVLDDFPAHELRGGRLYFIRKPVHNPEPVVAEEGKVKVPKRDEDLVLGADNQSLDYTMAACCLSSLGWIRRLIRSCGLKGIGRMGNGIRPLSESMPRRFTTSAWHHSSMADERRRTKAFGSPVRLHGTPSKRPMPSSSRRTVESRTARPSGSRSRMGSVTFTCRCIHWIQHARWPSGS